MSFNGLMGGAQFGFQSIGDGSRVDSKFFAVWKNYAFFGNILPTLRSYSDLRMELKGRR